MLYEKLQARKKEMNLTTQQLSQLSGVPEGTINKILNGETRSPRYDTLKALEAVLFPGEPEAGSINEAVSLYDAKKPGKYTLEDYYQLPDDIRAELIDGEFIYMEAPSFSHQDMIIALLFEIESHIRAEKGTCKVLPSPLDVQLDCDNKTMVQPDIAVICDKSKCVKKGIFGAPDMCIEIISESSRKLDFGRKVYKYMNAGVREYWIVDIKRESVVCYYFEDEEYPVLYTFNDKVPVHIFRGALKIDFAEIKQRLEGWV